MQFADIFQSTLSVRRATDGIEFANCTMAFQSTLSVRRATAVGSNADETVGISIHALRKESDEAVI